MAKRVVRGRDPSITKLSPTEGNGATMAKLLKKSGKAKAEAAPAATEGGAEFGSTRSAKNVRLKGKTNDMKVSQCYKEIFEANERLANGKAHGSSLSLFKGRTTPVTDEAISAYLKDEYGSRGNDNHLVVSRNRHAYVNGTYPQMKEGEKARTSNAYAEDGSVVPPRARGFAKKDSGKKAAAPAKGKKVLKKKVKTTPAAE